MKKIKLDMYCIVLLLFFKTVASSHVLTTDCSPSIKNITCDCSNISLSCHGVREDYLDVVELVTNISDSFGLEKRFSVDITIENIVLNLNSSFKNVTVSSLKLGSGLSHLPDTMFYGVGDSLHVLNLSFNNFATVPSGALMTLKQLHTLDLSHNNITTISKNDFKGLDNLRAMNLEYNIISVIESDAFLNLPLLQMLHLDRNALASLNSSAFKGLLSLNQLSISGNGFDSLKSESFMMLSALKILHADKNSLMDLENIQMDSVKLQELSVQHCGIEGLLKRDSLKSLPNLTSADLSYNNITEIQSFALTASFQLKRLNLSYNNIRKLQENAFCDLFNLITLDLQHNEIQIVPKNAFYNLTRLKHLNLNNNKLHAFLCHYTASLFSLESIHLENNKIKVINSGAFIYSQNLTELKLAGNELNCSCYMYDFSTYLVNRTSYWMEDISAIKCSSPQSEHGKSVINIDYIAMKCHSQLPCESQIFENVDNNDYDEEESTVTTLDISDANFTVSGIFENFSTTDTLNGYSSISDNGTLFSVVLTSSTDHTDVVPGNYSSLPPTNTVVQFNNSATSEPTVNLFLTTTVYENPVDVKNFSVMGKKLCVEWSVSQAFLGNVSRCLLKYAQEVGRPAIRKYVNCPLLSSRISSECLNIKVPKIIELCVQVINSSNKVFAEHCVSGNETLFSVPQTSSTGITVVNTTSSMSLESTVITVPKSTTPTLLGVMNVSDSSSETSTTSIGVNSSSSGGLSDYTVLGPFSSETSLLTQTTLPELTSEISNVTSKLTEFPSSSSGPASTTKALSASDVNETSTLKEDGFSSSTNTTEDVFSSPNTTEIILYKHSTFSSDALSTASDNSVSSKSTGTDIILPTHSLFASDPGNFSSLSPDTTVNDSAASELIENPFSSTAVYNYPIDIKNFSLIGKKLCVEWSVNQRVLNDIWHCLLSYALGNKKYITCPSLSSRTTEECLFIKATVVNELCIQIINSSNEVFAEHCVHEHHVDHPPTTVPFGSPVSHEHVIFNITHLSILREGDAAIVKWTVDREEPLTRCSLKLNIESNTSVTIEKDFECTPNSYMINSTENNVVYEICLTSYHVTHDSVTICRDYHMAKTTADAVATADAAAAGSVKPAQYYTYAVLIGLLVLVICFIAFLLVRAMFQKGSASDAYNVFRAEQSISIRKGSEQRTVNQDHTSSRYSYTASETV